MAAEVGGGNYAAFQAVANTTGQFPNNLFKICAVAVEHPGNLISSPLSAQLVLIMAAYGAAGNTATQMRTAVHIPKDNERDQSGYKSMIESFNTARGVELRIANKIYTASGFEVKSAYSELTTKKFLSASQKVDFRNPATAAATINSWCEGQTNNRIKDVINPDALDPNSKMVLVNAVYFNGKWVKQFDSTLTEDKPFHLNEKSTKNVSTMSIKEEFRFGNLPELNARFLEIPYQGNEFSMVIILPNKISGFKQVQENLHRLNLKESLQRTWPSEIVLSLPKFKTEGTMKLNEALKKLGMTDMFEDHADFSGTADTPLKVSDVVQKAFIEVDEEGSTAAAVTVVSFVSASLPIYPQPPPTFTVDRPYHYVIYHLETGISLFTGIVTEPHWA